MTSDSVRAKRVQKCIVVSACNLAFAPLNFCQGCRLEHILSNAGICLKNILAWWANATRGCPKMLHVHRP